MRVQTGQRRRHIVAWANKPYAYARINNTESGLTNDVFGTKRVVAYNKQRAGANHFPLVKAPSTSSVQGIEGEFTTGPRLVTTRERWQDDAVVQFSFLLARHPCAPPLKHLTRRARSDAPTCSC